MSECSVASIMGGKAVRVPREPCGEAAAGPTSGLRQGPVAEGKVHPPLQGWHRLVQQGGGSS